MGKFDGILICTDLDGTLLKGDKTVSVENTDAIEYFKANGGKFTFVTGRMPYYAVETYNQIKPNAPVGCINGGGLYDYESEQYIWKCGLSVPNVKELLAYVDENLPEVSIALSGFHNTYFAKNNAAFERFRRLTKLPNITADYHTFDGEVGKILFGTDVEESMQKLIALINTHPRAEEFDFIRSERTLYEILPKGIGKGTVVTKLAEHLHIDITRCIAIGDYNNDVSMIRAAGVGVAVANACPEALAAADIVTASNEEHAIAKVIEGVESGKICFNA